jgi:ribosomal protein S18 acetylase RimI-like enzyme
VGLVGDLLERAARATPAAFEDRGSGWWLRYADDSAWWSGAVLAHGPADRLERRIDAAERFYAERDAVACFQVCEDCPAGLDPALAARGYRLHAPIALLTRAAGGSAAAPPAGLTVRLETSQTSGVRLTVLADGEPAGTARAVAEDGWTGVFGMATSPRARRRGVARLALATIADWAEAHGAGRLYLQVEQSNIAARRLYEATGFTRLATYHYRLLDGLEDVVGRQAAGGVTEPGVERRFGRLKQVHHSQAGVQESHHDIAHRPDER